MASLHSHRKLVTAGERGRESEGQSEGKNKSNISASSSCASTRERWNKLHTQRPECCASFDAMDVRVCAASFAAEANSNDTTQNEESSGKQSKSA